jgi:hypothetical protein
MSMKNHPTYMVAIAMTAALTGFAPAAFPSPQRHLTLSLDPPMNWGLGGLVGCDRACRCVGVKKLLVCPAFPCAPVGPFGGGQAGLASGGGWPMMLRHS